MESNTCLVVSAHSHSGNESEKGKLDGDDLISSNRESIRSNRKRRPDFLTTPASSLFLWNFRRRASSNRKIDLLLIHIRSIPVLYESYYPPQILGESAQSWKGTVFNSEKKIEYFSRVV